MNKNCQILVQKAVSDPLYEVQRTLHNHNQTSCKSLPLSAVRTQLSLPLLCGSLLHAVESRPGPKPLDLLFVEGVVQLDVVLRAIRVLQCRDDLGMNIDLTNGHSNI